MKLNYNYYFYISKVFTKDSNNSRNRSDANNSDATNTVSFVPRANKV